MAVSLTLVYEGIIFQASSATMQRLASCIRLSTYTSNYNYTVSQSCSRALVLMSAESLVSELSFLNLNIARLRRCGALIWLVPLYSSNTPILMTTLLIHYWFSAGLV